MPARSLESEVACVALACRLQHGLCPASYSKDYTTIAFGMNPLAETTTTVSQPSNKNEPSGKAFMKFPT